MMFDAGTRRPANPSAYADAGVLVASVVTPCASNDFVLNAPCRVVKVGGRVEMSATEQPGVVAGTYVWSTTSSRIRLLNANSARVVVTALSQTSSGRDAETIQVTRTAPGCAPITKSVAVTVANLTFSASPAQRYGYDNFDTPANPLDDHVCVQRSGFTFVKVDIAGGAVSTDFDFVCADPTICAVVAPGGGASFDLRLNGGATSKGSTTLRARGKCAGGAVFAQIEVHVYKEREVDVVVAKFDATTAGTGLRFPTADYAAHASAANAKLKEAVVKYNITNFDAANAVTPVAFAAGGSTLTYDIKNNGGADLNLLKAAMAGAGDKVRVAIVRNMRSYYYLRAAAPVGATTCTLTASTYFTPGTTTTLGTGASAETVTILTVAGNTITFAPLAKAHASGEPIEFPAAGWASDPIVIKEGSASLDVTKWTVLHEVGHIDDLGLNLRDIIDATDFMHWQQYWTDYRLRYCPRLRKYPAGTTDRENQWERIPRV